jgi:hypothetical protein
MKSLIFQNMPPLCPPHCITSDTPYSYISWIYIVLNTLSDRAPLIYTTVALIAYFSSEQLEISKFFMLLHPYGTPLYITFEHP